MAASIISLTKAPMPRDGVVADGYIVIEAGCEVRILLYFDQGNPRTDGMNGPGRNVEKKPGQARERTIL